MADVVKFKIDVGCYPRFRYFQNRVASIYPRFKGVIDRGKLAWRTDPVAGIARTPDRLEQILQIGKSANNLKDTPSVIVINDKCKKITESDIAVSMDPFQNEEHQRTIFSQEKGCTSNETRSLSMDIMVEHSLDKIKEEGSKLTVDTPYAIVVAIHLTGKQDYFQVVTDRMKSIFCCLSSVQQDNLIVYIAAECSEEDRLELKEKLMSAVTYTVVFPQVTDTPSLAKTIQTGFETKAVRVLEMMYDLISAFRSRRETDAVSVSFQESIVDVVQSEIESIFNMATLEDLETMCHPRQKATFSSNKDPYDISEDIVRSQKLEETMGVSSFELPPPSLPKTFRQILRQYFYSRVTNSTTNFLAKTLRLPLSVVIDFLQMYELEKKLNAALKDVHLPETVNDAIRPGKRAIAAITRDISKVLIEAESFAKEKKTHIDVLFKIDFEIAALLRATRVHVNFKPPPVSKLSKELQLELLRQTGINGCGHIYNKLTIIINCDLDGSEIGLLNSVQKILSRHRYTGSYEIHRAQFANQHRLGVDGELVSYGEVPVSGTLGMFLYARKNVLCQWNVC